MKQMDLRVCYSPKNTVATLYSDFSESLINVVNMEFNPERPNKNWVTDITYIWTTYHKFVYLTTVMDLYSRKILAWDLSYTLELDSVVKSIKRAKETRHLERPSNVHSDCGVQYVSKPYASLFEKNMSRSYSRKGNPLIILYTKNTLYNRIVYSYLHNTGYSYLIIYKNNIKYKI